MTADVLFVNGATFTVNLSQKIRLFNVEFLPIRTAAQSSSYLTEAVKLYARGGFSIRNILMDQEFDKAIENIPAVDINTVAAREHVG